MRSVEDAVTVARTLKPVIVKGPSANEGALREIYPHYFVGGNANADTLANGAEHAAMAEARLKTQRKSNWAFRGRLSPANRSRWMCWSTMRQPATTSRRA